MIRHVVVFTWKQDATREQQETLATELRKLPAAIDTIRAYQVGPDLGMNPGNYRFAVVADFDDVDGYLTYRDHPVHRAVIKEHVEPILATRAAVQYELTPS
jgi:Stress responsive A/B Barrel Domain